MDANTRRVAANHPVTDDQILLIHDSFDVLLQDADGVAEHFYHHVFALDPAIRTLFPQDMREQHQKLMTMLNTIVTSLWQLDAVLPIVEQLGQRHARYGVKEHQYATIKTALLRTLERQLGAGFTPEVAAAWEAAAALLLNHMSTSWYAATQRGQDTTSGELR